MFDPNELLAGGNTKFLNSKFLRTLPKMALKVTITGGGTEMMDDRDKPGQKKKEFFLKVTSDVFEGEKQMALNKTNLAILVSGLGAQPDGWRNRQIGVFFDPTVKYGGEAVGGLKVKVFEADPFADAAAPVATVATTPGPVADEIPF